MRASLVVVASTSNDYQDLLLGVDLHLLGDFCCSFLTGFNGKLIQKIYSSTQLQLMMMK